MKIKHIQNDWSILATAVGGLKNLALLDFGMDDGINENVPLIAGVAVVWRLVSFGGPL